MPESSHDGPTGYGAGRQCSSIAIGVLNRPMVRQGRPYPPASLDELELYPDAAGASLRRLQAAGFTLVVVTNQPDVARGLQHAEVVHEINRESAQARST